MSNNFFYILLFVTPFFLELAVKIATWPSRRNIVVIADLPFFILRFFIGVPFFLNIWLDRNLINEEYLFLLAAVIWLGSITYCFSFILGFYGKTRVKSFLIAKTSFLSKKGFSLYKENNYYFGLFILMISVFGILLYIYSYSKMGFIPMFAENPFAAKYFSGKYQDSYRPVAHLFRSATTIAPYVIFFLALYLVRNKKKTTTYILFFSAFLLIFALTLFTLRRGLIAIPFFSLAFVFCIWYKGGKWALWVTFGLTLLLMVGSAINGIVALIFGAADDLNFLAAIPYGSPDFADLLFFWREFHENNFSFTYGTTMYGGLVPYHYDMNPSVFTKIVVGGSKNAATGGFRLPYQIWGYVSFGYAGVFLFMSYLGFMQGLLSSAYKHLFREFKNNKLYFYLSIFIILQFFSRLLLFPLKMMLDDLAYLLLSIPFFIFFTYKIKIS